MPDSRLWRARTESLDYLAHKRPHCADLIERIFAAIDLCMDEYESSANSDVYARVCGLTLLKAKNFGVGAYSLILDGLAQEAGALIRPFLEYTELLTYFREFPHMVARAMDNDLPKAGDRAKAINGRFKKFREYLNSNAAHSSYSYYSLSHLLERDTGQFKKLQLMVPQVLDRNTQDFTLNIYFLLHEAVQGLVRVKTTRLPELAALADGLRIEMINEHQLSVAS